jgi:LTXXQ motif family protein
MMTGRLEALHRLKAAVDPLYAALSDEQKKTAVELLMGPMAMM